MIDKQEIIKYANAYKLQPFTIEKDYVLGWILMGIQKHPETSNTWIFKGGTCLKKCFFNLYRFSEDLDFSLTNSSHLEEKKLQILLTEIGEWVQQESGIEITSKNISLDRNDSFSAQGKIPYLGPLKQQKRPLPNIKLDLTAKEKVILSPEKRAVFHAYSDSPQDPPMALCYPYEEIFAEKLRAFSERMRPRDLFDIIHLYQERHRQPKKIDKRQVLQILKSKCAHKNIPVPTLKNVQQHPNLSGLPNQWEDMLAHQIARLDPYEKFWEQLPDLFTWIYE